MGAKKLLGRDYYPRYTIEDWEQWEGQWELIDGVAWAMSPAPNSDHQELNGEFWAMFRQALRKCKRCKVYLPVDLKISEDTIVQPDLLVICNGPERFTRLEQAPSLVLEILSPRTATKDLHIKSGYYATMGIPYYLVAHPTEEWLRVMVLENGEWITVKEGRDFTYEFDFEDCKVNADFSTIWPKQVEA